MQRDSLESGPADHESARRAPIPPVRVDERGPGAGDGPAAHGEERDWDRHPVLALGVCRSEVSHGESPSGWRDRILPSRPRDPHAGPVDLAEVRSEPSSRCRHEAWSNCEPFSVNPGSVSSTPGRFRVRLIRGGSYPMLSITRTCAALSMLAIVVLVGCARSPEAEKARHLDRADRYFGREQYREAVIEYSKVLRIDGSNPHAVRQLALAHYHLGELGRAFPYLLKSRESDPGNLDVRLKLGAIYLMARQPTEARREVAPVLRSEEHTSELQSQSNLVCRLLLEKKKKQSSTTSKREAITCAPLR